MFTMPKPSDYDDVTETPSCSYARNLLFTSLYREEKQSRLAILGAIGSLVEEWTHYYLRHTRDLTHHPSGFRPLHQPINQSPRASFTTARNLKRESSSKLGLEFDDVFDDFDGDSDPRIVSASRSPIAVPLTPTYDSGFGDDDDERPDFISPTFTISYNTSVLAIFEHILNADDRSRLEDLKDEVLTVHEMKNNLDNYYLTLLRLSTDCPHKDIRISSRMVLQKVVNSGMQLLEPVSTGPSRLIPFHETIGLHKFNAMLRTDSNKLNEIQDNSDEEDEVPISPIHDSVMSGAASIAIPGQSWHTFHGRSRSRGRGASNSMSYRGNRRYNQSFGFTGSNSDRGTPLSPPSGNDILFGQPVRERRRRKHSSSQGSSQGSTTSSRPASKEVHSFHKVVWMTQGRVTNMNKILSFFPKYATVNMETIDGLVNRPGSALSRVWKLYIGILAAAEHKCQYFVSLLSRYFLDYGGNRTWLRGLEYAPKKLQRLAKLNTLLAHQPWRLTHGDIQDLIKGTNNPSDELGDNWSTSEVVLALCILSYYHAQSGFALACGLVPETDLPGGTVGSIKSTTLSIVPYLQVPSKPTKDADKENASSEMKRLDLPRTPSPGISLLTRKRQQMTLPDEGSSGSPDKWLKTPTGSIPASHDVSPLAQTFRVGSGHTTATPIINDQRSLKLQKRRKSFEDCVTAEDIPPPALSTSLSAPGSYIPVSSVSQYHTATTGREFFLSPSSSTSSLVESSTKSLNEQVPINVFAEDTARFLLSPSKTGIAGVSDSGFHEEFNLNSEEYSFLPMEEFDWERHACEVIGEYVEGLEDVLDSHFQAVRKIYEDNSNIENEEPLSHPQQYQHNSYYSSQPYSGRASRVGSIAGISEFSIFDGAESFYTPNSRLQSPIEAFHPPTLSQQTTDTSSSSRFSAHGQPTSSPNVTAQDIPHLSEAVWFYSLRLLGIQKDDYSYSHIKFYLPKGSRVFLRRICEQPELISMRDWKGVGMGLKSEDVVLTALLATQARFMGELLYGIKAVCEYRESRY
ncbi:Sestrin-1 [Orbilia oligospora]|uniref:Sestrin-1 n=1 Tax=Orbilia oligospora TaxID=2813651 RepID=A0A7C8KL34_ORBOL|nr:Sestrin-1 [Orbilia oligospora]KAF3212915.1 Sestrin-1 [Orbilia oligospora]